MRTVEAILAASTDAIVTVGEGRGFLVALPPWPPMVITAAHCLPFLPPANPAAFGDERTYGDLVGPIETAPAMAAECLFVDPIADVAVLGCPDHHARYRDATAYEAFVTSRPTLRIGALRRACPSWLLTIGGHWEPCHARPDAHTVTLIGPIDGVAPGTSGSPIVTIDACAVGVVTVPGGGSMDPTSSADQPLQPLLVSTLPRWLLPAYRGTMKTQQTERPQAPTRGRP
jgi:hypothetical protein